MGLFNYGAQMAQANAQEDLGRHNRDVAYEQARQNKLEGNETLRREVYNARERRANREAAAAALGLNVQTTGTTGDVFDKVEADEFGGIADLSTQFFNNALAVRHKGDMAKYEGDVQAASTRAQAKAGLIGGIATAALTVATGGLAAGGAGALFSGAGMANMGKGMAMGALGVPSSHKFFEYNTQF